VTVRAILVQEGLRVYQRNGDRAVSDGARGAMISHDALNVDGPNVSDPLVPWASRRCASAIKDLAAAPSRGS
jgi:hypothetical protein